jgi:hypothetical protein
MPEENYICFLSDKDSEEPWSPMPLVTITTTSHDGAVDTVTDILQVLLGRPTTLIVDVYKENGDNSDAASFLVECEPENLLH